MTQETKPRTQRTPALRTSGKTKPGPRINGTTKKAQLIQMLSRKSGADVAAISEKFGWLPHTTRAALSGLRKAGFELAPEKMANGKPSRYRITAIPVADAA